MNITKLKLENFRNYDSQEIEFNKGINVIYGDNAQGKTNILESIVVLALTKSYKNINENNLIRLAKKKTKIKGFYFQD